MTRDEDYVFRYKLDGERMEPLYRDPLVEMIRVQLESLLNVIVPLSGGREVQVDGFRLLCDDGTSYRIVAPAEGDPVARAQGPGAPHLCDKGNRDQLPTA